MHVVVIGGFEVEGYVRNSRGRLNGEDAFEAVPRVGRLVDVFLPDLELLIFPDATDDLTHKGAAPFCLD